MYGFDTIYGNDLAKKNIRAAAQNSAANHAYLITGPKGCGKSLIARVFAKALVCESGVICGVCPSCRSFDTDNNPDVYYIVPEKDKKTIGVGGGKNPPGIREKVLEPLYESPLRPRYKVFIIDDADIMTPQAQNALLKGLEEPPDYGVFLFTTDNPDALLPTVLSRAMRLNVKQLPQTTVYKYLIENLSSISNDEAERISLFAAGSIGRALKLCGDAEFSQISKLAANLVLSDYKLFSQAMDAAKGTEPYKERIGELFGVLIMLLRDIAVYKTCGERYIIWKEQTQHIKKSAERFTADEILTRYDAVLRAAEAHSKSVNFTLNMDVLAMDAGGYI